MLFWNLLTYFCAALDYPQLFLYSFRYLWLFGPINFALGHHLRILCSISFQLLLQIRQDNFGALVFGLVFPKRLLQYFFFLFEAGYLIFLEDCSFSGLSDFPGDYLAIASNKLYLFLHWSFLGLQSHVLCDLCSFDLQPQPLALLLIFGETRSWLNELDLHACYFFFHLHIPMSRTVYLSFRI